MRVLKTVRDADLDGKKVLIRFDLNTPIKDGKVDDDERIVQSLPTLKYILDKGGIPVIMAHLGRPKGTVNKKYTLLPVKERLEELLGKKVTFLEKVISSSNRALIKEAQKGDIFLLENIRFEDGEEKNTKELSEKLAKYGEVYVNDAFGCAHRNHASTEGVSHFISKCYAGFLMEKEYKELSSLKNNAKSPFVVVVGGSKISSKITVLESFLKIADSIIIGGGMAYTFLKAQGINTGKSLVEDDYLDIAKAFLKKAEASGKKIVLPLDHVCAKEFSENAEPKYVNSPEIPDDLMAMDIGEKTLAEIKSTLSGAKTIFWNGPVGVFEFIQFAKGTNAVAQYITDIQGAKTVVGGGDSVSAIKKSGLSDKISHISTGGGASLEFLEGKYFAAVEPLFDRKNQRKMVIGNWKMNMNKDEMLEFVNNFKADVEPQNVEIGLAGTAPVLDSLARALNKTGISVYAQNVSQYESGAYTGEYSCDILRSIDVRNVIIGHSERRIIFKESSTDINKKVKQAIANRFNVILCIGESDKIREEGKSDDFLVKQMLYSIRGIKAKDLIGRLTIAYEPIWAIGTGKSASSEIAESTLSALRAALVNKFGQEKAGMIKLLYGGSVKNNNVKEYLSQDNIDGVLVGGASLKEDEFAQMVKIAGTI